MAQLIKLVVALGVIVGIIFLVTGEKAVNFPKSTDEGFQVKFENSETISKWKNKVEDFFAGVSTSTEIESSEKNENQEEADTAFFKELLSGRNKTNTSANSEKSSPDFLEEPTGGKNFIENIVSKAKEWFEKPKLEDEKTPSSAFSEKVENVPTFTIACFPKIKQVCSPENCREVSFEAEFSLLDKEKSLIAHCDADGCVIYDAEYGINGEYENFQPNQSKGYIITKKIKSSDQGGRTEYTEIVTSGVNVTVYFGYCLERQVTDN